MPNEKREPRKPEVPQDGGPGGTCKECLDLLGQTLDAMARRARTEEAFSPDLAGGIEPTLKALESIKTTYIDTIRAEMATAPVEARQAMDRQLNAAGATDLLRAALAVGQIPSESDALIGRNIIMASGARRIPWLEIIKEIVNVILDLLPVVPGLLKKIIKEILKIIDKIFGGMPHEDNSPATETSPYY